MSTQLTFAEYARRTLPEHCYLLSYWHEACEREGYESIAEAVVAIYRETGSLRRTARRLTFSRETMRRKLRALGEPMKRRGGRNNPWGRAGKGEE